MNYSKFTKFMLLSTMALFVVSACTNLDVSERDSIVLEDTGNGAVVGDATSLLASAYVDLGAYTDQANIYSLFDHSSDEMIPPTRGTDWGDDGVWRTLHQHTWDAGHLFVLNTWNQLNQRVFKLTQILEAASPAATAQQAAEAKFLRAFHMYNVMDLYGQVPFRHANEGPEVNPTVMTRSEAFDFVEKDLTEALTALPDGGPKAFNSQATKAAAHALLARLYLNKAVYKAGNPAGPYTFEAADMDKVIQHADAVTAAGYSLQSNYFQNFTKNADAEVIFTSAEGSPQNRWFMTLHYNQNPSGWNGFTTLADFYNKFEDSDIRKGIPAASDGTLYSGIGHGFLVGIQHDDNGGVITNQRTGKPLNFTPDVPLSGANTDQGIRVIKYHPADAGQYIFLRYADVFLMKAEAIMRGGNGGGTTALDMVNQLRTLRGATTLGSLTEQDMLDERGRELYWEGIRRVDQVRFGTFATGTWSYKSSTDPAHVLYPIPSQALVSNPNLQQNPGYR